MAMVLAIPRSRQAYAVVAPTLPAPTTAILVVAAAVPFMPSTLPDIVLAMAGTVESALVELRVLDGANLYFPRPAIKLTLDVAALLSLAEERAAAVAGEVGLMAGAPGPPGTEQRRRFATRLLAHLVRRTAAAAGVRGLAVRGRPGPAPAQVVVAYPWRRPPAAAAPRPAGASRPRGPGRGRSPASTARARSPASSPTAGCRPGSTSVGPTPTASTWT